MNADFVNDTIKVHVGTVGRGSMGRLRPTLQIASSGVFLRLESWDNGELVNAEEMGRFTFAQLDLAQAAFLKLIHEIQG